jgi:myo-inositol-1(or 4)-monophosphatase
LDPIDGSLNYLQGTLGLYATSLALLEQGHRVAATIHMHQRYEALLMERDKGIFWAHDGELESLTEPPNRVAPDIGAARICIARGTEHPRVLTQPPLSRIVSRCNEMVNFASCSVGLACVALGRIDALVIPGQHLWDFAAGACIIQEMGGHFATWENAWLNRVAVPQALRLASPDARFDVVATMNDSLFGQIVGQIE